MYHKNKTIKANESLKQSKGVLENFLHPNLDAKPMLRMWFPDAGAGEADDGVLEKHIKQLADAGFGGVEVAMIADAVQYTSKDADTYGWGTDNWKRLMRKILKTSAKQEKGFKTDFTISSHWPPIINTIDPNDEEAATELSYAFTKIKKRDIELGIKTLPLPKQKNKDLARPGLEAPFIFTDTFVSAVVMKVSKIEKETGKPIFEFDNIQNVTKQSKEKENAGFEAGVPDRTKVKELKLDYEQEVVGTFREEPKELNFVGKVDSQGRRKRMADWQKIYETHLSDVNFFNYQPDDDETIKEGDYVIFASYFRGTGQIRSGGEVMTMPGRTYAANYFNKKGIQAVINYWKKYLIDDEILELLKNGLESIFEDSIETTHDGPFWSSNLLDKMKEQFSYEIEKYVPIIMASRTEVQFIPIEGKCAPEIRHVPSSNFLFDCTSGQDKKIVSDYLLTLGELFKTDHVQPILEWVQEMYGDFRAQAYVLPGLSIVGAAAAVGINEGDNATFSDGLRMISAARNILGKKFTSIEACTFAGITFDWTKITRELNENYSQGANRVVLHGTAYGKTFNHYKDTWPGWNWGGEGIRTFATWDARNIFWDDIHIMTDYIARTQSVLQNAKCCVDIAVMTGTEASFELINIHTFPELLERGYSYNYLDETVLDRANVMNGRLFPTGPAYKLIIIYEADAFCYYTFHKLYEIALEGLPILFVNCKTIDIFGTSTEDERKKKIEITEKIKALDNVIEIESKEELIEKLKEKNIVGNVECEKKGLEVSCYEDKFGKYYYVFNESKENAIHTMIYLEGKKDIYILNPWTGNIEKSATVYLENNKTGVAISLAPCEAVILTENITTTQVEPRRVSWFMENMSNHKSRIKITENFMKLESYGPDNEKNKIDPKEHKIVSTQIEGSVLGNWKDLKVSQQFLNDTGVTCTEDISGIGYYQGCFELKKEQLNQMLCLYVKHHKEDMITKIIINGIILPALNPLHNSIDIVKYVKEGRNDIEIKLSTSIKNRLAKENQQEDRTDYGLIEWWICW